MFIENMRHAKHKKRILVAFLMVAVAVGLFAMYGNVGSSSGISSGSSSSTSALTTAEDTADSAASDAKSNETDMDAQGMAASAYLSLASYQTLYLQDSAASYKKALKYAEAMVTACGSAETPDYTTAYGYEFSAYQGLDDADGLSAAFNESLTNVELNETYLNTYYTAMSAVSAYDQFTTDMATVTDLLNEKEASGDDTTTTDSSGNEVTTSDLIDYVASLVTQATTAESGTTDSSDTTSE